MYTYKVHESRKLITLRMREIRTNAYTVYWRQQQVRQAISPVINSYLVTKLRAA